MVFPNDSIEHTQEEDQDRLNSSYCSNTSTNSDLYDIIEYRKFEAQKIHSIISVYFFLFYLLLIIISCIRI